MKTIDKSKLMKRAWKIYYGSINTTTWAYELTFAESLKKAWALEKSEAAVRLELESGVKTTVYAPCYAGAANWHANGSGKYFGD